MATIIDGVKTLQIRNAKNGDFDLNLEGCDCAYLESLIYNAYPSESETGNPIYIDDGADDIPVKELIVNLEPKQDLKGYDHPWIGGAGVNKLNLAEMSVTTSTYGISSSIDGEDFVFSGTYNGAPSNPQFRFASYIDRREIPYQCKGFAVDSATAGHYTGVIGRADSNKTLTIQFSNMVQGETYNFRVRVVAYEGDTAPTEWSPYSNICPISGYDGVTVKRLGKNLIDESGLPKTISGNNYISFPLPLWAYERGRSEDVTLSLKGSLGNGKTRFALYIYDTVNNNGLYVGDSTYLTTANNFTLKGKLTYGGGGTLDTTKPLTIRIYSQPYDSSSASTISGLMLAFGDTSYEPYTSQEYSITFPSSVGTIYGGRLNVTTGVLTVDRGFIASYNGETLPSTWISDRDVYASGTTPTTGAQVVYELATPTTVQLTPTEVTTLLGNNTISSDGSMDLKYRADISKIIEKLTNAIISMGGNI